MNWAKRLFTRRELHSELSEEIRAHIEEKVEELVAEGMPREEAEHAARREFGNVSLTEEDGREVWRWNWIEDALQDVRFGLRQLRKSPGFTATAILTLALGIGANTAIFSVVNAVLLRPLPFKQASRLVALHEGIPKLGYPKMGFSPPDLEVFEREQKSFSAIGAYQNNPIELSGQAEPDRVTAARISASLFPMLGVEPMLGRNFTPQEDERGHNVAILSYELWQRRYGGDPEIVGKAIEINRTPYTVIGVMGQRFEFPLRGPEDNGTPADLWVPMAFTPAEMQDWGGGYFTSVVGRLRPDVTLDQASGEAETLAHAIVASYPPAITGSFRGALELEVHGEPFQEEIVAGVRTLVLVLMASVAFVLLIACANIATLLVSRAATRQREISVRTALGASRMRLVRQLLTESLLLATAGGGLGILLAGWGRNLLLALVPASIPLPRGVALDGNVLGYAACVSILAAILFGLLPALQASGVTVQDSLRESGRGASAGRSRHRVQGILVTVEFALALVLLIGAGLLVRSLTKIVETNPGIRAEGVLTLNVPLPRQAYPKAEQMRGFYEQLLTKVSNLPGVRSAAISNDLPLSGREMVSMTIEGRAPAEAKSPEATCQTWVMGNYFQTMGIPLKEGRGFTASDRDALQPVAIVSEGAARKFWPGQDALGKRIRWGVNAPWQTVVGIVGDVKQGPLNTEVAPHVYRPYNQLPAAFLEEDPFGDWRAMNVIVRTQGEPGALSSAVVGDVHSLDPDLAVANIRTMTEAIHSSFAGPEFNTLLIGALAGLALFLSAMGIYGVLGYTVAQQAHEIGIRMALGARRQDVFRLILGRGARLAGLGAAFGLVIGLALSQLMKGLLYGVSALDPITLFGVVILLLAVALAASYIPARSAMKVDPMVALRYE